MLKNVRCILKSIAETILFRKNFIEMVYDESIELIEHSRHYFFCNFMACSCSAAIAARCFFKKKPAIDVNLSMTGKWIYIMYDIADCHYLFPEPSQSEHLPEPWQ